MKQQFKTAILALVLGLAGLSGRAQDEKTAPSCSPKWVSDKGFWVVENTLKNPEQSTVYFYANTGELVYKEGVTGKLKLHKRKTLLHLRSVLETAVAASEKKQPLPEGEKFFAGTD